MEILFCTDGSQISYDSIINFSKWFKNLNTDILSVADWTCLSDTLIGDGAGVMAYCTNNANAIINNARLYLEENGIKVTNTYTNCGAVVDTILEVSNKKNYEYLVLGSNGKKGLQKWLGSVSQEISELSKSSVYVSKGQNTSKKIAFALDEALLKSEKFENTLENINLDGKEIHLLTVFESPDYMFLEGTIDSNWANDIRKKQENAGKKLLYEFEEIFNDYGYNINSKKVLSGAPSKEIVDYCSNYKIDLVVCGMKNKKLLSRIFSGSVSKRILENTDSDILIMK